MAGKLLLIDGNSIINRAFYGLPDLTNSKGLHTNAVLGFLNILFKVMDEEKPDYLYVAFDLKAPTFRHKMFAEYKGTRKGMPDELREQVPLLKDVLETMGICIVQKEGYEADDILGTLAKQGEKDDLQVTVLSGDRDLLQIATDVIKVRIPKTHKGTTEVFDYYAKDVKEQYQVTPVEFIDMKALMGDASDNIPGVPQIGEKTAAKIIMEFGSIENAYEHIDEVMPNKARETFREHYDLAVLSKVLATIKLDCELEVGAQNGFAEAKVGDIFTNEVYEKFSQLEFKSLLSKCFSEKKVQASIATGFKRTDDFNEVEALFLKAEKSGAGIFFVPDEDNNVLGLALSFGAEETFFIEASGFISEGYLKDKVNRLRQQAEENGEKIYFLDLKEQLKFVSDKQYKSDFDVQVAAYLLSPLNGSYDYVDLARDYIGMTLPLEKDLLSGMSYSKALEDKPEAFLEAVCYHAAVALLAGSVLPERLKAEDMYELYTDIELPLVYTLFHMEQEGIRVERDGLKEYGEKLGVRIEELEQTIYELAGMQFNINSPKQLGEVLFEELKLPGGKKTKSGYSTAADVLEKLADEHRIVKEVLEYRQLAKLKSTYADGLAAYIGEDGRIHGKFNQTITATGRISSTEPNLQNIPIKMEIGRKIRKVFIPKDDYVFVDADYSQIELRVLAHLSGDESLIEAYRQDRDIHRVTASQVFHVPFEEVTALQRRNAKAVNFGIIYGMSSFGLSQDLSVSKKEAAEYIEKYFATYPKIKDYLDGLVAFAKENGYVRTLLNRKRPIPEIKSSNFMQRAFGERIAMNSPIQGTAADIIKIAMIRVDNRLREEGFKSRLLLQVHDELLIETHKDEVDKVCTLLKDEMENAIVLRVALCVDMNTGSDWFETK